ncbi:MAG: PASTA domain-containing protein [Coriobacteriia bacterium]|nr:PASTA domain-containing protein [Coriobacteriia bacterium]
MSEESVLKRYEMLEVLRGEGAVRSYRAKSQEGVEVCLKFVWAEETKAQEAVAKLAALESLEHPNVAKLLETGLTENGYFIAREWVQGTSLDTKPMPLEITPKIAAEVVAKVCAGLASVHERGLVAENVRPSSVVVTPKGDVKLVDVGVPADRVGGAGEPAETALYTSPEEIAGSLPSPSTDIYRLGLVLYELLAGEVPFAGVDAAAVAQAHAGETPKPPSATNPEVSPALDGVTLKALQKDPVARYASASAMGEALEAAIGKKRMSPWVWVSLIAVLLALVGVWVYTRGTEAEEPQPGEPTVAVPQLVGATQQDAETAITDAGLDVGKVGEEETIEVKPGIVTTQTPAPGKEVAEGSKVDLTVSKLPAVEVPKVTGDSQSEAISKLGQVGLRIEDIEYVFDKRVDAGFVVDQDPQARSDVDLGSSVRLTVSKGEESGKVPSVVGLSEEDAGSALEAAGFSVKSTKAESADVPAGNVIEQSPAAASAAPAGSTVTITVSKGAPGTPQAVVPDLLGMGAFQAAGALRDAGLKGTIVFGPASSENLLKVVDQDPRAGATVDQGTRVTVTLGLPEFLFGGTAAPEQPVEPEQPDTGDSGGAGTEGMPSTEGTTTGQ